MPQEEEEKEQEVFLASRRASKTRRQKPLVSLASVVLAVAVSLVPRPLVVLVLLMTIMVRVGALGRGRASAFAVVARPSARAMPMARLQRQRTPRSMMCRHGHVHVHTTCLFSTTSSSSRHARGRRGGGGGGGGDADARTLSSAAPVSMDMHVPPHPNENKDPTRNLQFTTQQASPNNDMNNNNDPSTTTTSSSTTPSSSSSPFQVTSDYCPTGDQPHAIHQLTRQLMHPQYKDDCFHILQGITGTGKTFCLSHVICQYQQPTLVLCHNKTLAAQLARELKSFLEQPPPPPGTTHNTQNEHGTTSTSTTPSTCVELFVSYYNHYVPESFVETTNTYIAKKSSVNQDIDALRHKATRALLECRNRDRNVVVVASVSCIYGLGLPKAYLEASRHWNVGETIVPSLVGDNEQGQGDSSILQLLQNQLEQDLLYSKPEDEHDLERGQYQLTVQRTTTTTHSTHSSEDSHAIVVSVWPPHEHAPVRVELQQTPDTDGINDHGPQSWSNFKIASIQQALPSSSSRRGQVTIQSLDSLHLFPAKHHVTSPDRLEEACLLIEEELEQRLSELRAIGKLVEAQRLQQRVLNDLLLLRETGTCPGVENYSRHMAGRAKGEPPDTLLNYMNLASPDWLLVVDESHVTLPQLKAMYGGDRARKEKLVKHGYRLPSAMDNRPLKEDEFWERVSQAIFVSATPAKYELAWAQSDPVQMTIRPTFVCDPEIHVRPSQGQLEDLLSEIRKRAKLHERTLALALTKRDAEDMASYLIEQGVSATYIHSGLTTPERADALKALQKGDIDCLVGVNLLREGLDLPQVSLVAILNADSEGFLRSETALLQTVGRAARNVNGEAVFYADRVTESMRRCMDSTHERRARQLAYNEEFGCTSRSTKGSTMMSIFDLLKDQIEEEQSLDIFEQPTKGESKKERVFPQTVTMTLPNVSESSAAVVSDHLPSKPGVYFWQDEYGKTLYIGKAKKLRSRVKSYLNPGAKHSTRILAMLAKAKTVEFMLTPSDRDALVLESNLIKHHQPPYNVLLKDDEQYPYICATVGDAYPRFHAVPRRQVGEKASNYKYYGPYPHWHEVNKVLDTIEEKYDLRAMSFAARHGGGSKAAYGDIFSRVLSEVFETGLGDLPTMRSEYEEAKLLFDNVQNKCRDVVAVGQAAGDNTSVVVQVIQLRNGLVAGRFSYMCQLPVGLSSEEDMSLALETVLERQHYPSGDIAPSDRFSFFPDEILLQFPLTNARGFKSALRSLRNRVEPARTTDTIIVRTPSKRGRRKETDARAMSFAVENAAQEAIERSFDTQGVARTSMDGTALEELRSLLSLDDCPRRIECYDISHTQGTAAVGSRVVFIDGKPAKHLYRRFNIKTVEGINDYASIEEVLERRFRRQFSDEVPDLVVIDGGIGQLGAAVKGMARGGVVARLPRSAIDGCTFGEDIVEETFVLNGTSSPGNDTLTGLAKEVSSKVSIPVVALAKDKEDLYVHGMKGVVNESPDSAALLLLRALRDESHRFALSSHRRRRAARNRL